MEKSELKSAIAAAFAKVPYPGDDAIGHAEGRDEGEAATEAFRGRTWQSLKPRELWVEWLGFITPEAFHYYLPAYLIASLEEEDFPYGEDELSAHLTPPPRNPRFPGHEEYYWENFSKFTVAQKKVIGDFLDWEIEDTIKQDEELGLEIYDYAELRHLRDFWRSFAEISND